jgi:hypothetical protein
MEPSRIQEDIKMPVLEVEAIVPFPNERGPTFSHWLPMQQDEALVVERANLRLTLSFPVSTT